MKRYTATLTQNCTITPSLSNDQDVQLLLIQGGTGSYTVTWSGVTKWFTPSGSAPTLQTAVGASDLVQIWQTGSVVYAMHIGDTGPAGSTGSTGPAGITWRRAWSPIVTYAINDVVSLSGSSYIALQASSATNAQQPDQAPTYWGVLAQGGTTTAAAASETVDTFVRANVTPLETDTGGAFTYAKLSIGTVGTLAISSNLCIQNEHTSADAWYRASPVLSSADHHAQITVGAWTASAAQGTEGKVMCRMSSSASTFYYADLSGQNTAGSYQVSIGKCVAGTLTGLAASSPGSGFTTLPQVGDTLKLTVAGTTLTAYYKGVQFVQTTDSSITTGNQCGIGISQHSSTTVKLSEFRFGV